MWIVGLILLSLLALLAIPIRLDFEFETRELDQAWLRIRWLFGLVRVKVQPGKEQAPKKKAPKTPRKRARLESLRAKAAPILGSDKFRRRGQRFARRLWTALHPENVQLRARIGLGDPAETGCLWGVLGPIAGLLSQLRSMRLTLEPEFVVPALDLDGRGAVTIMPLELAGITLAFILNPSVVRTLWGVARA